MKSENAALPTPDACNLAGAHRLEFISPLPLQRDTPPCIEKPAEPLVASLFTEYLLMSHTMLSNHTHITSELSMILTSLKGKDNIPT